MLWPYLGSLSLIIILGVARYLANAWLNADLKVAAKAGFRPPTLVQQRYLDHLNTGQEVFTHPSLLPVVGTLASSRRRLILLTSGVINELTEKEMRQLIAALASRDQKAVFGWTFHLATGGAGLFSRADKSDPFAQSWAEWGRKTLLIGALGGVGVVIMAILFAAPLSMVYRTPIDVSPIVPVLWIPFIFLAIRFAWRRGNAALIKPAAGNWNKPVAVEATTFVPMQIPLGAHPNLRLMRHGLLIAKKKTPVSVVSAEESNQW